MRKTKLMDIRFCPEGVLAKWRRLLTLFPAWQSRNLLLNKFIFYKKGTDLQWRIQIEIYNFLQTYNWKRGSHADTYGFAYLQRTPGRRRLKHKLNILYAWTPHWGDNLPLATGRKLRIHTKKGKLNYSRLIIIFLSAREGGTMHPSWGDRCGTVSPFALDSADG